MDTGARHAAASGALDSEPEAPRVNPKENNKGHFSIINGSL